MKKLETTTRKIEKRNKEQMRKETRAYLRGETEATTCSNGGVWFACGKRQGVDEEEPFSYLVSIF